MRITYDSRVVWAGGGLQLCSEVGVVEVAVVLEEGGLRQGGAGRVRTRLHRRRARLVHRVRRRHQHRRLSVAPLDLAFGLLKHRGLSLEVGRERAGTIDNIRQDRRVPGHKIRSENKIKS